MLFLDEVKIFAQAGKGGNGSAHFKREAFRPDGGPDGGHGGKGGNVVVVADASLNTLVDFLQKKKFVAADGEGGGSNSSHGKNGKDLVLKVPVGTMVFDGDGDIMLYDLSKEGDSCVLVYGGKGGVGNIAFKTSTNQSPKTAIPGAVGEAGYFVLSMRLVADVGLVGLPNAGKSSFLCATTNAKPKVGDYAFTTTIPSLGFVERENYDGFVIADIPGLVEGAHFGRGLGHRFLRHIERCKRILHLIDVSSLDPVVDYTVVRNELVLYFSVLSLKQEIVLLNKVDLVDKEYVEEVVRLLKCETDAPIFVASTTDPKSLSEVLGYLYSCVRQ